MDDHATSLAQTSGRQMRRLAAAMSLKARTISARDLFQIDTPGGGYAVIRIVRILSPPDMRYPLLIKPLLLHFLFPSTVLPRMPQAA